MDYMMVTQFNAFFSSLIKLTIKLEASFELLKMDGKVCLYT